MDKQQAKKGSNVFPVLKYFFPVVWKTSKRYLVFSVLGVIAGAAYPFVDIFMLPLLIDELCRDEKNVPLIILYAALMVGLDIMFSQFSSQINIYLDRFEDKFLNQTREDIAYTCMEMDFALTEDRKALDQVAKAKEGVDYSGGFHAISIAFFAIITNIIEAVGVIALLVIYAPWMLLIIGVCLAVSAIISAKKNKVEIEFYGEIAKIDRRYDYFLWEQGDIRFGKDIRLFGSAGMLLQKTAREMRSQIGWVKRRTDKMTVLDCLDKLFSALRDFGTYLYLGILAVLNIITIGQFSQLTTSAGTFGNAVNLIIFNIQDIVKRCNYAYETIKLFNYPHVLPKGTRKVENLDKPHEIEFRNVSFSYPKTKVQVLKNVSIKIKAGEKLSVVGLNGAGKTTFIKLLCRLYDADEGEILLDGVNIAEYDYEEYMKLFSVVFQDFRLLAFSVRDNILLGSDGSEADVEEVLEKAGLLEKAKSLPKGLDTAISREFEKDAVQLSGGEQQKLALARALYKNAPVVILDEPTAALDPIAEYEIYCRFNNLVENKTAVYISHRLSSCKFCDRIAVFSDCTIKELGTHDELVKKENGIYAEMFAAQAQYYVSC